MNLRACIKASLFAVPKDEGKRETKVNSLHVAFVVLRAVYAFESNVKVHGGNETTTSTVCVVPLKTRNDSTSGTCNYLMSPMCLVSGEHRKFPCIHLIYIISNPSWISSVGGSLLSHRLRRNMTMTPPPSLSLSFSS